MKKNVTITLPDEVARWARVEAAKAGMSLSRWIGDRLERDRRPQATGSVETDWLDAPLWPSIPEPLPTRQRLHEMPAVNRHGIADRENRGRR